LTLDIEELLGQHWWTVINWLARAIENSTKHFDTHGHSKDISSELACGALVVDAACTFENLDNSLLSFDLEDLTLPDATISKPDIDNLCVFWELDVVKNDKRSLYVKDGSVIDSRGDVVICGDSFEVLLHLSFTHLIDRHFLFLILGLIKTTLFFML
jgi:hypothetical protein